ncbi:uncharacterized protein YEL014C [Saccharomyces cerevisiae S288C]|uniref:Uncharacterized protein YEL014C n=2 Tax=Saccharomyces cerevisiae TaxID=4932 RepID=YEB4_YEAST|eukprot:NP_001335765.1 hypothetical protein YEL014C [Saccharomyces cerevisiae S288C]
MTALFCLELRTNIFLIMNDCIIINYWKGFIFSFHSYFFPFRFESSLRAHYPGKRNYSDFSVIPLPYYIDVRSFHICESQHIIALPLQIPLPYRMLIRMYPV